MLNKTIAIYGGSFDPPHMGHQFTCLYLLEALGVEAVWLMPVYVHPQHKKVTEFVHRVAMCERLALPFADKVVVSTFEKTLAEQGGVGRTYDLLIALQKQFPEHSFAFVIGADILTQKNSWYRFEEIEAMVPLIVLGRENFVGGQLTLPNISSTHIRSLSKQNQPIQGLVPLLVEEYIVQHSLYSEK